MDSSGDVVTGNVEAAAMEVSAVSDARRERAVAHCFLSPDTDADDFLPFDSHCSISKSCSDDIDSVTRSHLKVCCC